MAKKPKLLSDLFHDTLKDVYFAENKILKTLPKMAKAAQSKDLKAAFVKHEKETRGQVKRLQQVFNILSKPVRAKTCDAIMGIIEEGVRLQMLLDNLSSVGTEALTRLGLEFKRLSSDVAIVAA